jgi:hypothetical protein
VRLKKLTHALDKCNKVIMKYNIHLLGRMPGLINLYTYWFLINCLIYATIKRFR